MTMLDAITMIFGLLLPLLGGVMLFRSWTENEFTYALIGVVCILLGYFCNLQWLGTMT